MSDTVLPDAPANVRKGKGTRRFLLVLLALLVTVAAVLEGVRHFYLPGKVKATATARLSEALGAPVQARDADVGWRSTALRGVRLYESGSEGDDAPWADIEALEFDVGLFDMLRGQTTPRHLTLKEPAVTLRFNSAGGLATELPEGGSASQPPPDLHIQAGRLTIHQEGRTADLAIGGIDADLQAEEGKVSLEGTISDPLWSGWTVRGVADRSARTHSLTLCTEQVSVEEKMLARLPFVPPEVWRQLHVEGETPVELVLRVGGPKRAAHYRVALAPRSADVYVRAIDFHAERAHGHVLIEDRLVQLDGVEGEVAGGKISLQGQLDFRANPAKLDMTVDVRDLDVSDLPRSWSVPKGAKGKLSTQLVFQMPLPSEKGGRPARRP